MNRMRMFFFFVIWNAQSSMFFSVKVHMCSTVVKKKQLFQSKVSCFLKFYFTLCYHRKNAWQVGYDSFNIRLGVSHFHMKHPNNVTEMCMCVC